MTAALPALAVRMAVDHFPAAMTAIPAVRAAAVQALRAWRLDSDSVESAQIVVSELATNAAKISEGKAGNVLWLTLTGPTLTIEVWDDSNTPPALAHPNDDDENGRGLVLVDALCLRWSWYRPRSGGKIVWAQLAASTEPAHPDTGHTETALPKRSRSSSPTPAHPTVFEDDPALLRRVLDGLRRLNSRLPEPSGLASGLHPLPARHAEQQRGDQLMAAQFRVSEHLRPVVLLARMRSLVPGEEIERTLGLFHPPISPTSAGWRALCSALDAYDAAEAASLDTTPARHCIIAAASALPGTSRFQAGTFPTTSENTDSFPTGLPRKHLEHRAPSRKSF